MWNKWLRDLKIVPILQLKRECSCVSFSDTFILLGCICSYTLFCSLETTTTTNRRSWAEKMASKLSWVKIDSWGKILVLKLQNYPKECKLLFLVYNPTWYEMNFLLHFNNYTPDNICCRIRSNYLCGFGLWGWLEGVFAIFWRE